MALTNENQTLNSWIFLWCQPYANDGIDPETLFWHISLGNLSSDFFIVTYVCVPKELIGFFCCPKVKIMSLLECQASTFWCLEFLWPMEKQNIVKKNDIRLFSWMLDCLLQKMCFRYNEWINPFKSSGGWSFQPLGSKTRLKNRHLPLFRLVWVLFCPVWLGMVPNGN